MNRRISSSPSKNERFEIRSVWSTKKTERQMLFCFLLRFEGTERTRFGAFLCMASSRWY